MAHVDRRPGIRPRPSIGRRLDIAARASFPACITVLLMLLTQAPLGLPEQVASLPAVTMGCVWFWSLFRPLGVGAFTLLAVHGVALAMRRSLSQRGGAWIWIIFAGVAAAASLVIWLMVMLLTFQLLSPYPAIFIAVLAVAIFPLLAVPFAGAHRSIANPERA
jgi:rod shape-determining protein MreD